MLIKYYIQIQVGYHSFDDTEYKLGHIEFDVEIDTFKFHEKLKILNSGYLLDKCSETELETHIYINDMDIFINVLINANVKGTLIEDIKREIRKRKLVNILF